MTKRRKQGEGTLRLRKDGRWEGRIVVGYDDKGLPITKNVTTKTKTECTAKLQSLKEQYERSTEKINSEMLFGEWIDFWYRTYCKHTIRVTTQEEYKSQIYNHIIYSHITDTMQRQAAAKIDRQIGGRQELPLAEAEIPRGEERGKGRCQPTRFRTVQAKGTQIRHRLRDNDKQSPIRRQVHTDQCLWET